MVVGTLFAHRDSTEAIFSCSDAGRTISFVDWTRLPEVRTANGSPAGVGTLCRLVDDGSATLRTPDLVSLPAEVVATLAPSELNALGLPKRSPFILSLRGTGALSDSDFRIVMGFLWPDGHPVVQPLRTGPFLRVGDFDYTLSSSAFNICESVRRLDEAPRDMEARLRAWGEISSLVGADVSVDASLSEIRVAIAEAFELHPFINDSDEPDFDPVLGRWEIEESSTGESSRAFRRLLPPNREAAFLERFRGLADAKGRYSAGPGAFVIVEPNTRRALAAVREAQSRSPRERLEFLQNPTAYVRAALGDEADDDDVSSVFAEEGLSERVRGIGVWCPIVLPWVSVPPQSWLPPEHFGLRLDGRNIEIGRDELEVLRDQVSNAIETGQFSVEHNGQQIPANEAALSALDSLVAQAVPASPPSQEDTPEPVGDEGSSQPGKAESERLALLVLENFHEVGFALGAKRRTAVSRIVSRNVRTPLLAHQKVAIDWLQDHWELGSPGALLADDMGLGKTLQALAFLAWVREQTPSGIDSSNPMLVVAPTGLLRNWIAEADQHLEPDALGRPLSAYGEGLRSLRTGDSRGRGERSVGVPSLDVEALRSARWVLTTYETLRDYQFSFARVPWSVAVFDETQKIKNPAAGVTVAALAINVDFCLGLSGTPVENRPAELWSLMDRISPGFLGSLKEFSAQYEGRSGPAAADSLMELHSRITTGAPAMMLRRLKEDHIPGLPEKRIHTMMVDMPPAQAHAYDEVLRGAAGAPILGVLQNLRKISLHPHLEDTASPGDYIKASARLRTTFELLKSIQTRDEKVIVFIESLQMQDFLVEALGTTFHLDHPVLVINGAVPGERRKSRVDEFQARNGFDVILMSPKAGGVGLTVTEANHVIHLSRWWNPAVEDQCTDRVYRIGQKKPVEVYCPIARHPRVGDLSFDLVLNGLIERKRDANRRILAPMGVSAEDLAGLHRAAVAGVLD